MSTYINTLYSILSGAQRCGGNRWKQAEDGRGGSCAALRQVAESGPWWGGSERSSSRAVVVGFQLQGQHPERAWLYWRSLYFDIRLLLMIVFQHDRSVKNYHKYHVKDTATDFTIFLLHWINRVRFFPTYRLPAMIRPTFRWLVRNNLFIACFITIFTDLILIVVFHRYIWRFIDIVHLKNNSF